MLLLCFFVGLIDIQFHRGRYGGVKLEDWFHPNRRLLTPEQFALLNSMTDRVTSEELVILNSILLQFAP